MRRTPAFIASACCLLFSGTAHAMCGEGRASYTHAADGWYYGLSRFDSSRDSLQKVTGADPGSFHVLPMGPGTIFNPCADDSGYAADKFHVYQGAAILPGADPSTFAFISAGVTRDATHIYSGGKLMQDADAATFSVANSNKPAFWAQDATHYFQGDRTVSKAQCKKRGDSVLVCGNYILVAGRKYSRIDTASLAYMGKLSRKCQPMDDSVYRDRSGLYEFHADGTILRVLNLPPEKRSSELDTDLENWLCDHPARETMPPDK